MCIFTQKIPKFLLCFFTKHYIFKNPHVFSQHFFHKTLHFISKHLNPSNYKTCLYNLFVYLYTKNTKVPPVFFHKTLHFSKILMCSHKTLFFTKTLHFISKHLNPSNYKTCLYNLFACLYTKNTKDPPVFFHKFFFHKHPVIYPSNKICFISKKDPPVFFTKHFFTNILSYI